MIARDRDRLACFDRLAAKALAHQDREAGKAVDAASDASTDLPAVSSLPTSSETPSRGHSYLDEHWELSQQSKRGTLRFRQHQTNYLIANYSDAPNDAPYRPFRRFSPGSTGLSHNELVFQLGFKMKFLENPFGSPVDLWFGYTQQSFWQAGNRAASSPFRETNYQPELIAIMPLDFALLGMRARFAGLGLLHQSNGQGSTLSRSWNRVYAELGLERGGFTLVGRVWRRVSEPASDDDNPRIVDYMGNGDLVGTYRWRGHEFSVLARHNFSTSRGATQLSWAFPISEKVKGYVQFFSGYGQSLIDYNHSQNTLGAGVQVTY